MRFILSTPTKATSHDSLEEAIDAYHSGLSESELAHGYVDPSMLDDLMEILTEDCPVDLGGAELIMEA